MYQRTNKQLSTTLAVRTGLHGKKIPYRQADMHRWQGDTIAIVPIHQAWYKSCFNNNNNKNNVQRKLFYVSSCLYDDINRVALHRLGGKSHVGQTKGDKRTTIGFRERSNSKKKRVLLLPPPLLLLLLRPSNTLIITCTSTSNNQHWCQGSTFKIWLSSLVTYRFRRLSNSNTTSI